MQPGQIKADPWLISASWNVPDGLVLTKTISVWRGVRSAIWR